MVCCWGSSDANDVVQADEWHRTYMTSATQAHRCFRAVKQPSTRQTMSVPAMVHKQVTQSLEPPRSLSAKKQVGPEPRISTVRNLPPLPTEQTNKSAHHYQQSTPPPIPQIRVTDMSTHKFSVPRQPEPALDPYKYRHSVVSPAPQQQPNTSVHPYSRIDDSGERTMTQVSRITSPPVSNPIRPHKDPTKDAALYSHASARTGVDASAVPEAVTQVGIFNTSLCTAIVFSHSAALINVH
ncbi:hypothetical protein BD410DRAFT_790702 [Rickenella mellea]|uniref:Uncharacterized protein n=1 Tax=Rickenella mellea TaxID=50990 RepID=A0A4Y7Q1I1_9AGAM|nr:hypothetical protein BD410DRAFT_790702 [Rickenella mellea]